MSYQYSGKPRGWVSDDPEQWRAFKEALDNARSRSIIAARRREALAAFNKLTTRQQEVASLIYLSRKKIAERLNIQTNTVSQHLQALYDAFGCYTQIQLLNRFIEEGFVRLPVNEHSEPHNPE